MMRALLPLTTLLLAGCMADTPAPKKVPPAGAVSFIASDSTRIDPVPDDWWRLYEDPALDRLVQASLGANADLRVAFHNLAGARAALRQAQAARLPQTTIESGLTVDETRAQPSANAVSSTDWDLAATASWDVDLFGRLRASALAARADAEAMAATRDAVQVAVVADTVQAYVDYCGATRAITIARAVAAAQDRSVALTKEQLDAGEVSPLELSQISALAAGTRAAIAPFEAQQANALYRLATLQARAPSDFGRDAPSCTTLPQLRSAVPIADGTALLLRRPDIREAERKLAAATARVGASRADLYPKLNLGGALGLLTGKFDAALTPLISWSFPNQAPARARLAQARATEQAILAGWDVVVLKALREVETAIAAYDAEKRRNADLATSASEAQAYARRAAARVRLGDAAGLLQIDAERSLATARLQQAQSDMNVAQAEVALFRALGGGWRTSSGPQ